MAGIGASGVGMFPNITSAMVGSLTVTSLFLVFMINMNSISQSVAFPLPCSMMSATELGELFALVCRVIYVYIFVRYICHTFIYMHSVSHMLIYMNCLFSSISAEMFETYRLLSYVNIYELFILVHIGRDV